MWVTGSDPLGKPSPVRRGGSQGSGFTLIELLAAITIVGLVLATAIPASVRFFESMQYRQAIRDIITTLGSARYSAVNRGESQDVAFNPRTNELIVEDRRSQLPGELKLTVHTARELNRPDEGVVRFYPEGGSSGGTIEIERPGGDGVRISVDWLVGRVTQESYALD